MRKFLPVVLLAIACSIVPLLGQADDSTPAQGVVTSKAVKHALREAQSGKYLRSNGASADPSWEDVSVAAPVFSAVLAASNVTGGHNVEVTTGDGIAFGTGTTPVANAIKFGDGGGAGPQIIGPLDQVLQIASGDVQDVWLKSGGDGSTGATGAQIYLTEASGGAGGDAAIFGGDATPDQADKDGGPCVVAAGSGRGTGRSEVRIVTFAPTVSGTGAQTQKIRVTVDGNGNVVLNASGNALATNATDGFTYIPTCAGTPTGTPTSFTGAAPLVIDSTNNKLYVYIGGAWRAMN